MPHRSPLRALRRTAPRTFPTPLPAAAAATVVLLLATACGSSGPEPAAEPAAALPVDTVRVARVDHYTVSSRHVGRVVARRTADLGFTRSDRLVEVLVDEGHRVESGAPLARLDTDRLDAQRTEWLAQRRELQARLDLARLTLERRKQLAGKDSISTQRYDEARFEAAALEARLASIAAGLERVDIDIAESTLVAPFDGAVVRRAADEGAILAPGAPVVSLIETGAMEVRVGVPPAQATRLAVGDRHVVEVGGERFDVAIGAILDDIDAGTRTVTVVLPVESDTTRPLRHGELARLVLEERRDADGFWLPITALTESRRGLWAAYTLEPDDAPDAYRVARHELMMIHTGSDEAFVRGTLADGDEVVVTGLQRIAPGQRVQRSVVRGAAR